MCEIGCVDIEMIITGDYRKKELLPIHCNFVNVLSAHLSLFGSCITLFTHIFIKCIFHGIQSSLELLYRLPPKPYQEPHENK